MEANHFSLFGRQNQIFCCSNRCTESEQPLEPEGFRDKFEIQNAIYEYISTKTGPPPNDWDVSPVKDFSYLFFYNSAFNEEIGAWDTSGVTNMNNMFHGASSFNQSISAWDTSAVTDMQQMFRGATDFNQDIGQWNVSAVTTMHLMFNSASSFDQDIGAWDVIAVSDMYGMFYTATAFQQDLCPWKDKLRSNVNVFSMFYGAACPYPSTPDYGRDVTDFCQQCELS